MITKVPAVPYEWPAAGEWHARDTALLVIDMQNDFCVPGGYAHSMGIDIALTRRAIDPLTRVLQAMRDGGAFIVFTREGHRPDLSDLPANKLWRSRRNRGEIGAMGPLGRLLVRSEAGWDIVAELAPRPSEPIVDKPGKNAFFATDLDLILRRRGVRNLVFTGVTTDCCVHATMLAAADRGYDCLLLEDCCAASAAERHAAAVALTKAHGGQYGAVASSVDLLRALEAFVD
jgi:nicotinamidase-related amidase